MPTESFNLKVEELKKAKNLLEAIRVIQKYGEGASFAVPLKKLKEITALKNFERADLLSFSTEEELTNLGL